MFAPLGLSFLAALLLVQVNAHSHSDELIVRAVHLQCTTRQ